MKRFFGIIAFSFVFCSLSSCCRNDYADTVVFGTIRTADTDTPVAEAMAVKDGRYIYVGDKDGAESFIKEGFTETIHHEGMVMPGCSEGHAHYLMSRAMACVGGLSISNENDGVRSFIVKLKEAYAKARAEGKSCIFGFGWNYHTFDAEGMPSLEELDAICPDVALFINDSEGHKALVNSVCLQNAGILDKQGNVLRREIRGGKICLDSNGKPNGLLFEQAATYVRGRGLDFDELLTPEDAVQAVEMSQKMLLQNGYTSYMDGWSNYFGNTAFYKAAQELDRQGRLNILLGLSYEIESSCQDVDAEIAEAVKAKEFSEGHIHADYIKMFIDGTVEGGTGLTLEPYPDGHQGIANWEEDEVAKITAKANAQGLTMHIHTMGDGAVHRAVNAFERCGSKEMRNTIVHVRNIPDEDLQRVSDNGIVAVCGLLWHVLPDRMWDEMKNIAPAGIAMESYPMKSFLDHGAVICSHSDFPAVSGSPYDPFGIMEVAVTGSFLYPDANDKYSRPWWTEELLTREQAFRVLTINGAWQMHVEKERGSIKVGKYADFLLIDKDIFECPVRDIHKTSIVSTWFEGKKVYQAQ